MDQPPEEIRQVSRFDTKQAFIFLFAVSFGPAFIVVDLTTDETGESFYVINCVLLFFILLTFISNAICVQILTHVQSQTKLGSY